MGVADLADKTAKAKGISMSVEIKHDLTNEELLKILDNIADANRIVMEKGIKVSFLKDHAKKLNEEIGEQYKIISDLCEKKDRGYESKMVDCFATYKGKHVTFTDASTGEIMEQREMTEEEQLQRSRNAVDAESIIREASRKEK